MSESPPSPFDDLIGTRWGEMSAERATATLVLTEHHKQPAGVVHGGVYATLAESVSARATYVAIDDEGLIPLGQSNSTSFLRPATEGAMHVEAVSRHRGRTTWIWDVEISDDGGRLCAISRVTIAVRPRPKD